MYIANNPGVNASGCIPQEVSINNVKLAHAYVPIQKMCNSFTPLAALKMGTIFPPLTGMYPWYRERRPAEDE